MRSLWLTVFHVSVTWSHEFEAARIVASTQQIPKQEFNVHPYLQNGAKWLTLLWSESTQLTMDKADPVLYYLHHPAPSTHSILMLPPKERGLEIQFPPKFWIEGCCLEVSQVLSSCFVLVSDLVNEKKSSWGHFMSAGISGYPSSPICLSQALGMGCQARWRIGKLRTVDPSWKGWKLTWEDLLERYQALKCLVSGKQFLSVLSHIFSLFTIKMTFFDFM